jgi:hypothetical protein
MNIFLNEDPATTGEAESIGGESREYQNDWKKFL